MIDVSKTNQTNFRPVVTNKSPKPDVESILRRVHRQER